MKLSLSACIDTSLENDMPLFMICIVSEKITSDNHNFDLILIWYIHNIAPHRCERLFTNLLAYRKNTLQFSIKNAAPSPSLLVFLSNILYIYCMWCELNMATPGQPLVLDNIVF